MFYYEVIDSTNAKAHQLLLEGAAGHGDIVAAGRQTSGRGRLGRKFFSPEDGIYFSVIIRPDFEMEKATLVTVAAAVAAAKAIDAAQGAGSDPVASPAGIKWVNDIFCGGRKVCGILTEAVTSGAALPDHLIVGIGVNTSVENFPPELKMAAGAIRCEDKKALIEDTAELLLQYMDQIKKCAAGGKAPGFLEEYRARNLVTGKEIKVFKGTYRKDPLDMSGGISAWAVGIDDEGGLMVRYPDGSEETLTTGEVSIRWE